jgi:dihydroneopterin aldolase
MVIRMKRFMGKIYITGLAVDTLIGVYDWERERLTTLLLDVELDADLDAAMQSDNVDDTINYADVADCITEVGKNSRFMLLEAFGGAVMKQVLATFPAHAIRLKIVKPNILPNAQTVAVAMYQDKS